MVIAHRLAGLYAGTAARRVAQMSKLLRWGAPGLIALGALYVIGFVVYQQYVAEPSLTFSIRSGHNQQLA